MIERVVSRLAFLASELAVLVLGLDVVTIGPSDEIEWDLFGACIVAFAMVGAGCIIYSS